MCLCRQWTRRYRGGPEAVPNAPLGCHSSYHTCSQNTDRAIFAYHAAYAGGPHNFCVVHVAQRMHKFPEAVLSTQPAWSRAEKPQQSQLLWQHRGVKEPRSMSRQTAWRAFASSSRCGAAATHSPARSVHMTARGFQDGTRLHRPSQGSTPSPEGWRKRPAVPCAMRHAMRHVSITDDRAVSYRAESGIDSNGLCWCMLMPCRASRWQMQSGFRSTILWHDVYSGRTSPPHSVCLSVEKLSQSAK